MPKQQLFLASLMLITPVFAWHSLGHLTVARIASLHLSKSDIGSKSLLWANNLLEPFKSFCGEKIDPFTESATWPDKIKSQGWSTMADWHFTNREYMDPNYIRPKDHSAADKKQNITWAIHEISSHLSSRNEDTIGKSNSILGKSLSLRNLIHFVGDMHQPLHTTGRISEIHPNGDMGGNQFYIKHYQNWRWNNLHFIWDHLFDQGESELNSPLSQKKSDYLTQFSEGIMREHSYEDLKEKIEENDTPEKWNDEGFDIVSNFVYKGIVEKQELPQEYIAEGRQIVVERLALAGYRLADLMVKIYKEFLDGDLSVF